MLCQLRQLAERRVDLADAAGLFAGGRCDLLNQFRGFLNGGHNCAQEPACFFRHRDAIACQFPNLLCGHLAAFGELSYLGGDDGEALDCEHWPEPIRGEPVVRSDLTLEAAVARAEREALIAALAVNTRPSTSVRCTWM